MGALLVVNFTNTSQNATSYVWDFGNGTQSTLTNPSTTYTNPGFYTVKLIAQNATDIDSIISVNYIQVLDIPTASFSISTVSSCLNDNFFLLITQVLVQIATHGISTMETQIHLQIRIINIA